MTSVETGCSSNNSKNFFHISSELKDSEITIPKNERISTENYFEEIIYNKKLRTILCTSSITLYTEWNNRRRKISMVMKIFSLTIDFLLISKN